jgi:hypothetical protein
VFFLKASAGKVAAAPAETDAVVEGLLSRAAEARGERHREVNVFRNLGSFVVQASPRFVRQLLDQPQVRSARVNRPSRGIEQ